VPVAHRIEETARVCASDAHGEAIVALAAALATRVAARAYACERFCGAGTDRHRAMYVRALS
jgi:hypothetical protein